MKKKLVDILVRPMVLLITLITILSACTYSRWNYFTINEVPKHDIWTIDTYFGAKNDALTSYCYEIVFDEVDTSKHPRLKIDVDNIQVNYSGLNKPIELRKINETSGGGLHVGATNVTHWVEFGVFEVPKNRPDTIYIDQDITIFYRDTGEELTHFHYQTKAKLHRNRRWRIADYIEGT